MVQLIGLLPELRFRFLFLSSLVGGVGEHFFSSLTPLPVHSRKALYLLAYRRLQPNSGYLETTLFVKKSIIFYIFNGFVGAIGQRSVGTNRFLGGSFGASGCA